MCYHFRARFWIEHDREFNLSCRSFEEGYEFVDVVASRCKLVKEQFRNSTEVAASGVLPIVFVTGTVDETVKDCTWLPGCRWAVEVFIHCFLERCGSDVSADFNGYSEIEEVD